MMQESKSNILMQLDMDFLVHFSYITKLLRSRNYFTKQDFVNGLSRKLDIKQCQTIYRLHRKGMSADNVANKFLTEINSNATIIRNFYVDYLLREKIKNILNDVVFFEFKLNGSRTDINRINGFSYAFEIKSGRDKPNRAIYQTAKFSDVFDFVIMIVNNEEEYESLSDNIGITKYEYVDGNMAFNTVRPPKRNLELDSNKQLKALPKAYLNKILNVKETNYHGRENIIRQIINNYSEGEINNHFKSSLKEKYLEKWQNYISLNFLNN